MSKLFNTNMTSCEARMTLYGALDGKTREEQDLIYEEYFPVKRIIHDREIELGQQGWMMGG